VADEVVGELAEVVRDDHRPFQLGERVVVGLLDPLDEVVQSDGSRDLLLVRHASTIG
jgi:hypothetical protein